VSAGTLVVDIGGGSTELVLGGEAGVSEHASIDAGCVRQTELHLRSDPPAADELDACARAVRALLGEHGVPELRGRVRTAIGVAGTITTLAALDLGLAEYDRDRVHGHVLSRNAVARELDRLVRLPVAERRELPGLEPARAPVIVAGAVVLRELLDALRLDAIEASEHDILHGAALAAAELPAAQEGDAPPGAYTCC